MDDLLEARRSSSDDDEHDPEGAPLSGEWARLRAQIEATDARLSEIDAALDRILLGTYGRCEVCGEDIPVARLEARPTARRCVRCADLP